MQPISSRFYARKVAMSEMTTVTKNYDESTVTKRQPQLRYKDRRLATPSLLTQSLNPLIVEA
jgi:hypothetical protein